MSTFKTSVSYHDITMDIRRAWIIIAIILSLLILGRAIYINTYLVQKKANPVPEAPKTAKFADGRSEKSENLADSVVAFAKEYIGTPYYYTGKCKATGFDCSGFTSFVYGHFGIDVSPASKEQVYAGRQIPLKDASKADLLIFTGTKVDIREAGHVGIVISEKGEPIRFIHSSSGHAYGVTITSLSQSNYSERLLQVRRVIE
jgi:peptidoglycan DL-endopeptidase CwlO